MNRQKLPVGIDSFSKLRREDFYYVDKTGLIIDLLNGWGEVNLFTRPRRFGKTLNMSMLKAFFEIGTDPAIFDGLAVTQDARLCETYMGRYPVIFLTLKGVDGPTFEIAYDRLRNLIRREALRLEVLRTSTVLAEEEKNAYLRILREEDNFSDITDSLRMLSALLEKHYGQKVILLIDEYDVPLDKAYQQGYYDRMIDLIRTMFGAALKTNDSLFFAVLTGCLRVSKESIFTGLNNLMVHSISDEKYDEYFGFTEAEVQKLLVNYGLVSHAEEVREWYDGYRFGGQNVYCPWDVINYCYALNNSDHAQPKAYWRNTSGNDMVRRLISRGADATTQMEIEKLIAGQTIVKTLNENLTHNEIDANMENIWSLLYMTGYLTTSDYPDGDRYALRIPNREIRQIYMDQVLSWFQEKVNQEKINQEKVSQEEASQEEASQGRSNSRWESLDDLYEAFETGNIEKIQDSLNERLLDTVSFYDAHESFYHGFLLALLSTCADWWVSSNTETGKGRSDILVQRKDRKNGFVVEVKDVKDEKKLDAACRDAMKQIEEKDYTALLRRYRLKEIRAYGIAFWDKECKVVMKQIV